MLNSTYVLLQNTNIYSTKFVMNPGLSGYRYYDVVDRSYFVVLDPFKASISMSYNRPTYLEPFYCVFLC